MKTNLKPFDLEKAKAGAPVCTRGGRDVRIVCWDRKDDDSPIVALVYDEHRMVDEVITYTDKGEWNAGLEADRDLFMKPIKRKAWVVSYVTSKGERTISSVIFYSIEEAQKCIDEYVENTKEAQFHEIEIEE